MAYAVEGEVWLHSTTGGSLLPLTGLLKLQGLL